MATVPMKSTLAMLAAYKGALLPGKGHIYSILCRCGPCGMRTKFLAHKQPKRANMAPQYVTFLNTTSTSTATTCSFSTIPSGMITVGIAPQLHPQGCNCAYCLNSGYPSYSAPQQSSAQQQQQANGLQQAAYRQSALQQQAAYNNQQQAQWGNIERPHDHLMLRHKQVAVRPKMGINPVNFDTVLEPPPIRTVEGYILEENTTYVAPDGSLLTIDKRGGLQVDDSEAKVVYKANRVREFNPFINASDQLEKFIGAVGKIKGVDQSNLLKLPVEAFINWLIRQAAEKDGDSTENLPTVEAALSLPAPA